MLDRGRRNPAPRAPSAVGIVGPLKTKVAAFVRCVDAVELSADDRSADDEQMIPQAWSLPTASPEPAD